MERVLRLLEIIYASAVAHEIQNLRRDICCGCKIYAQDCLMLTEEEGWNMHGLLAMERVNSSPSVWHEFLNVLGVLNMDVRKEFADHLMRLQKDPDRYFVEALLQVYENNRAMVDILHNLSHPPPSLWNPTVLPISAILVVTNTMSREATKHSNRTSQTTRKPIEST